MPSPKSGKSGSLVAPAAPREAKEADVADPGEVEKVKAEQQQIQAGKYGEVPVKAHKPAETAEEAERKSSWIEIVLIDEADQPVPGVKYQIELPDNTVVSGTLDEKGFARAAGIEPGTCKITFPDLDQDAWQSA